MYHMPGYYSGNDYQSAIIHAPLQVQLADNVTWHQVKPVTETTVVKRVIQVLTLPYSAPAKVTKFSVPSIKDSCESRLVDHSECESSLINNPPPTVNNIEPAISMVDEKIPKLADLEMESSKRGQSQGYVAKCKAVSVGENCTQNDNVLYLNELPYPDSDPPENKLCAVVTNISDLRSPYVKIEINGYKTVFLVDTGATNSILTKAHAIQLGIIAADCEPTKSSGTTATGGQITCYGRHRVDVKLGSRQLSGFMEVADVMENGFLGMDFMVAFGCTLDFDEMHMRILDQSVPFVNRKGRRLACTCYSARSITIDPQSESIIPLYSHTTIEGGGLIEPNIRVVNSHNLIAARCYVGEHLVIRMANITSEPIHIGKDTPLAFLTDSSMVEFDEPDCQSDNLTHCVRCTASQFPVQKH